MKDQDKHANDGLSAFLSELRKLKEQFESAVVRIGIVGESGTGKSSLINRIFGEYVAPVGAIEQTTEATPYTRPGESGLIFVDLPGAGTPAWPIETYVSRLRLLEDFDAFLLVNRGRVMANDVTLYRDLCASGKHVFVVRNQFDSALAGEAGKPKNQQAQEPKLRDLITDDLRKQLGDPSARVYLTCAQPSQPTFDLELLLADVNSTLGEIKRVKFLAQSAVLGKQSLIAKQEAASKIVSYYASASALNAINPIPGVDVAVDVGLLITMSGHIVRCFGLTKEQLDWTTAGKANLASMGQRLATQFGKFLIREAVLKLLARFAAQETAKTVLKYIPFLGTLLAAGIGYRITIFFGNDVIEQCHTGAVEALEALQTEVAG